MEPTKIYGFVYLVGSTKHNWYKIGAALEPEKRIPAIQTVCPFDLETITVKHVPEYYKFEKFLHNRYFKNWLRGEWFQFTPEELEEVKSFILKGVRSDTRTKNSQPCSEPVLPLPSTLQPPRLQEAGGASDPELQTGRRAENLDNSDRFQLISPGERHPAIPKRIPINSEQYREYIKNL